MVGDAAATVFVAVLVLAAFCEIVLISKARRHMGFARTLCAGGFFTLAGRLLHLISNDELTRLHYAGMLPIMAIAVGRILASTWLMQNWPDWIPRDDRR